ncbi:hypothetical protein LNA22_004682 [Salmonella enterica subsp. enterica serovar Bovismorbificans]|nr:hypothetical protein [Salmonella enterica subsp. enterica serovar Bovismorbificans]EIM4514619.1 hypothetical protein [Salmonella enterica subsp. enterica serovar Bovismorbificans]
MRTYILELAISVEELVEKLGGTGRGLHEKTKSIAYLLEPKYERKLHMIASVRNKASHRRILPDRLDVYEQAVEETRLYLEDLIRKIEERKRQKAAEMNARAAEINARYLNREALLKLAEDEIKRNNDEAERMRAKASTSDTEPSTTEEKNWSDLTTLEKIGWGAGIAIMGAAVAYLKIKSRD